MLYNKTWGNPAKTPEQLMDLSNIIKWLESKRGRYNFFSSTNCLLAQYYKDHGYEDVRVSVDYVRPHGYFPSTFIDIPEGIHGTIRGLRSYFFIRETFKGALKRGRRLVQQERAYAL